MKTSSAPFKRWPIHLTFWVLNTLMTFNLLMQGGRVLNAMGNALYFSVLIAIPFYINYAFFTQHLFGKERRIGRYLMLVTLFMLIPMWIVNFTGWDYLLIDTNTYNKSLDVVINFIFYMLISNLIKGLETWISNRQQAVLLEKEKLEAELNLLRLQINPHFLFNTLNNIYTLAYQSDKRAAPMIAKLSHLLRYLFSECQGHRVPLERELALLAHYIDLEQLRIGEESNVDFYVEGVESHHEMAPLILLTLVENCFKHSDIRSNSEGWIRLSVVVASGALTFRAENSVSPKIRTNSNSTGIGNLNIREQLALNYPESHRLEVAQTPQHYSTVLHIQLDATCPTPA